MLRNLGNTAAFKNLGVAPPKMQAPFPSWAVDDIRLVERAISLAWKRLLADPCAKSVMRGGKEIAISNKLQDAIETILNEELIHGFSPAVFSPPVRGGELEDFSGRSLEKRPDLTFNRHTAVPCTRYHALFFECKLIGRGRTVKDYVNEGLERFRDGRYAWAMPHAGMIAYLVGAKSKCTDARAELESYWSSTAAGDPTRPSEPLRTEQYLDLEAVITIHQRNFVLQNGRTPGPLSLRHLWLGE